MTNLKQKREAAGLSQKELAKKTNINIRMLQCYEQGQRNIDGAKIETLLKISKAAGCQISDIIENKDLQVELKKAGY